MKKTIFLLAIIGIFLSLPAVAADWNFSIVPSQCTGSNPCTDLDYVLIMIVNISRIILALSGSAALLMFTYGGFQWIIAGGSQEKIQKGKSALVAAVVGLVIILGAWIIVNTTICAISQGSVACDDMINNFWGG